MLEEFDLDFDLPAPTSKSNFSRVVNYSEQCFWETGLLPTADRIAQELELALPVVTGTIRTPKFKEQLVARGIDVDPYTSKKVLTASQLMVANAMLNIFDKRSERQKLEEFGVSVQQYGAWKRTPEFMGYLQKRAEALFAQQDPEAFQALIRNVKTGDNSAIKLYMEMRGHYAPRLTLDINVEVILHSVVEILTRHITDPAILEAIAIDMENVIDLPGQKAG